MLDELDGGDIILSSSCISSTVTRALFAGGGAVTPELAFEALVFVLFFCFRRFLTFESIRPPRDGTVLVGKIAASYKLC